MKNTRIRMHDSTDRSTSSGKGSLFQGCMRASRPVNSGRPPFFSGVMHGVLRVLALALAGLAASGAWATDLPFYAALNTRVAPRVDGVLDDACWQTAEKTRPFVAIGGDAVEVATQAMASWDRTHLYVAFICPEPRMKDLGERIAHKAVRKFDESIELFLDAAHDRFTYLQLRVDILGNRDTHRRNDPDDGLTSQWTGAASRGTDRWTVELAVPFAFLGAPAPHAATLWTWNVNRQRLAHRGPVQWTCWSDTKGGFHSPARFGQLVFTEFRAWLRFYVRGQLDAIEQQMGVLAGRYPRVADNLLARLEELDHRQAEFSGQLAKGRLEGDEERRAGFGQGQAVVAAYDEALAEMRRVVLRDVLR